MELKRQIRLYFLDINFDLFFCNWSDFFCKYNKIGDDVYRGEEKQMFFKKEKV